MFGIGSLIDRAIAQDDAIIQKPKKTYFYGIGSAKLSAGKVFYPVERCFDGKIYDYYENRRQAEVVTASLNAEKQKNYTNKEE